MESFCNILKNLEGSVGHIIYRDYIVNRGSCIYCSLASDDKTVKNLVGEVGRTLFALFCMFTIKFGTTL